MLESIWGITGVPLFGEIPIWFKDDESCSYSYTCWGRGTRMLRLFVFTVGFRVQGSGFRVQGSGFRV